MRVGPYTVEPTGEIIERAIDGDRWSIYGCEITRPDGVVIQGSIEGDGYLFEPTTLTDENGTPYDEPHPLRRFDLAGRGYLVIDNHDHVDCVWIMAVRTDPAHLRQGVATALIRHVCQTLRPRLLIPGAIVAETGAAEGLLRVFIRECAAVGVRLGDYRLDPAPVGGWKKSS